MRHAHVCCATTAWTRWSLCDTLRMPIACGTLGVVTGTLAPILSVADA